MRLNKLFFKTAMCVAVLTGLTACGDEWLQLEPKDSVSEGEALSSSEAIGTARDGMYAAFKGNSNLVDYYAQLMFVYGDVRGEDIQYNATSGSGRGQFYYMMNYSTPENFYCSPKSSTAVWQTPYIVIGRANRIIAAENISDADDAQAAALVAQYQAEARVVRAFALFDLTRIYGKPYTQDNGESLGASIVTEPSESSAKPARSTVAQCYTQILKDLNDAIDSGDLSTKADPYYINVWSAKALLTRVYLTMGNYPKALSTAEDIIQSQKYTLWTIAQYPTAWSETDGNHLNEMLFEFKIDDSTDWTDRPGIAYLYKEAGSSYPGYGDLIMTESFLNMLQSDPEDVRNEICIASESKNDIAKYGTNKVFLNKFQAANGDARYDDVPVLRLSEVYLSAAEAAYNAGDMTKAVEYLNDIIENRTTDEAQLVTEETITLNRIWVERRKELVGEGQRFFDAMRRGETITRYTSASDQGWHSVLTSDAQVITRESKKALPLIPQDEINANPNIQQNPLY